jgi:hypothetical protein
LATEIYEPSQYIKTWNDVFDVPSETNLTFSKVLGQAKSYYIILQSYEQSHERQSQEFQISFTNEFNPFNVLEQTFDVLPGFYHTFKIVPSLITTTAAFDNLNLADRNCKLPSESLDMKLMKQYSR